MLSVIIIYGFNSNLNLKDHLNFFENGCITFIVYAVQKDSSPKNNILGLSTRVTI